MPRGFVHQAVADKDTQSFHLTLSTGLMNTWQDFLELLVPQALASVSAEQVRRIGVYPAAFTSSCEWVV